MRSCAMLCIPAHERKAHGTDVRAGTTKSGTPNSTTSITLRACPLSRCKVSPSRTTPSLCSAPRPTPQCACLSQHPPSQKLESPVEMRMPNKTGRCLLLAAAGIWATTLKRQITTRRRSSLDHCSQARAVRCCAKPRAWTGQAIASCLLCTTCLLHADSGGKRVRAFLSI